MDSQAPSKTAVETRAAQPHRAQLADHLQSALALASQPGRTATLLRALEEVAQCLPAGFQQEQIRQQIRDVRWIDVVDAPRALKVAEATARDFAKDLAFEPRIEAPLPAGFPAPTPVGELQVKHYPTYRMGQTDASQTRANGAFWTLFQHIESNEIAMTAPVEMTMEPAGERVRETKMAFLYRSTEQGQLGEQGRVQVVDVPAMAVLSLGCRGDTNYRTVAKLRQHLDAWIAKNPEWKASGDLRVMGYNSPMVPWNQRYFEIEIPIERVAQTPTVVMQDV